MKKRTLVLGLFFTAFISYSCGDQCFKCENVQGYPNSTICKDTWETTTNDMSPSWADYQAGAIDNGCVKQ